MGVLFSLSLSAIEKPIQIIGIYCLNPLTKFLLNTLILQMTKLTKAQKIEKLKKFLKDFEKAGGKPIYGDIVKYG